MATLSKHGQEIGRLETVRYTKAFFVSGDILINRGDGWKVYGKVKDGFSIYDLYNKAKDAQTKTLSEHPHFANWRKEITRFPLSKRWMVITAIELMPDDPDGVTVELQDLGHMNVTFDECNDLCRLYKLAMLEQDKFKKG